MMKVLRLVFLLFLISNKIFAQNTAKPWAYWWWPGSAVNKPDLRANLQKYAGAGFGGLHIIPIYGVKGEEENFINFLSPKWLEMVEFTVKEAEKLGLGIDMTLGTGWPFGGPDIKPENAAKTLEITKDSDGQNILKSKNTKQQVKRAAPGGEGLVLDHFEKENVQHYLAKFDSVFSKNNMGIRAFYNDSYEVYGADWTEHFFEKFNKRRGYSLEPYLSIFENKKEYSEAEKQIYSDYQLTVSELLLEEFTTPFNDFAKKHGKITRNESHGSPGNVLDLYAVNKIPETEFFGSKPYDIPLYRQDPNYKESQFGRPNKWVLKLASSPANFYGKKLVSSETATWLGNHFKVSLSQIKPIIDESFLGGVNHIFYHGVPYTPMAEPWPGWLFYASTNFNFNSHFWNELPLLNKYIENCQFLLQNSKHDNEILVYFPVQDIWHKPKKGVNTMDVHNIEKNGIFNAKYRSLLSQLETSGYAIDFVSDKQLLALSEEKIGENGYKVIIIPEIEYLPLETLLSLKNLQKRGLKVLFEKNLALKTTGFLNFEENQNKFSIEKASLVGLKTENIIKSLNKLNLKKEIMPQLGLEYLRKNLPSGTIYFIANQGNKFSEGDIIFDTKYKNALILNPAKGKGGNFEKLKFSNKKIRLKLLPGQSCFILLTNEVRPAIPDYEPNNFKNKIQLTQNWQFKFSEGWPLISREFKIDSLKSWTQIPDSMAQYFDGYGEYSNKFSVPVKNIGQKAKIELGDVRETAEVWINGQRLGTAWYLPFEIDIPSGILKEENEIKIKVRNLSANHIRYMDQQKVPWKKFYDINMVDIEYKPFDASGWRAVPSGLLGPITIRY